MKNLYSVIGLIVIFGLVAIANIGCKKTAGGGWIPVYPFEESDESSGDIQGKATFGFNMKCVETDGAPLMKGQLQFNDHLNKIKFHGHATGLIVSDELNGQTETAQTCADIYANYGGSQFFAMGSYTPQPKGKSDETDGGIFYLRVVDKGEPGPSVGDEFWLALEEGVYGGRHYFGSLGGGNIQVFED